MIVTTYETEADDRGTVSTSIQERKHLKNVPTKTLTWYGDAVNRRAALRFREADRQELEPRPVPLSEGRREPGACQRL